MAKYKMNTNEVEVKLVTVETKATGFPGGHLTAYPGQVIVTFPFDAGGAFTGHSFSIPMPADMFYNNFTQLTEDGKEYKVKGQEEIKAEDARTPEEIAKGQPSHRNLPPEGSI